jgi:hypothetical protein
LHGFDLDASQIAIDEEFFYFTEKFKRAEELKINIFNFNRASPSYIFRLNKYKTNKGYDIISPFGHLKHSKYDDSESAYKEWTPEDGDKEQSNIKYLLGLSDKFYWSKNTFFDARSFDFQKKYRKDIEHYLENGNIKGTRLEVFGEDNLHKIYLKYNQLKELDKRPEVVFIQEGLSRYRSFKDEVSYYYYFEPILERKHYSFILGTNAFVDKLSATLEKHNLSYYVDDQIDGLKEQIKTSVFYKEAMYSLRALPLDLIELITQWLSLVRIVSNYQLYSRSTNRKVINSNTSEEEDYYKSITSEEDSWYSKSIYNKGDTKDITISSTSDEDY